jgi:hypothetical protein
MNKTPLFASLITLSLLAGCAQEVRETETQAGDCISGTYSATATISNIDSRYTFKLPYVIYEVYDIEYRLSDVQFKSGTDLGLEGYETYTETPDAEVDFESYQIGVSQKVLITRSKGACTPFHVEYLDASE